MTEDTVEIGGKEYALAWTERSQFRMSNMGHERFDPNRESAWASAWIASMLNPSRDQQPLSAFQVFEALSAMGDDEKSALLEKVQKAFDNAKKPPKQ